MYKIMYQYICNFACKFIVDCTFMIMTIVFKNHIEWLSVEIHLTNHLYSLKSFNETIISNN